LIHHIFNHLQILDISFNQIEHFQANEFKNQIIQIDLTNNLLICNQDSFQSNILPLTASDSQFSFYYQNNSIRCNETKQTIRRIKQKNSKLLHLIWLAIIPIFIIFASFIAFCIRHKMHSKSQICSQSSINQTTSANQPSCSASHTNAVNDISNVYENQNTTFNQVYSHSMSCYVKMNRFPASVSRSVSNPPSSTQNNQNSFNLDYANVTFNAASNRDVYLVPMPTIRDKKRSPTYAEIVD